MSRNMLDRDIEELLAALEDGNISDDGLEDENEDDENFYSNAREIIQDLVEEESEANDTNKEHTPDTDPPPQDFSGPSNQVVTSLSTLEGQENFEQFDKRKLIWKKDSLYYDESRIIHQPSTTSPAITELDSPYQCFLHYFTPEFLQKIVDETNLFAIQSNPSSSFTITVGELKKFLGILIFMSVEHFPSVRSYWHTKFGYSPINSVMPVNRFETIRSFLHFNDNNKHLPKEHPDHDRLHKIRPVIDQLNTTFSSVALEQRLSIDEQMCSTKISHFLKQYLPNKPHKWGYKLYVICSLMGYAYRFEVYSGQEEKKDKPADEPDLGVTNNVVLRLTRVIPRMENHIVFFDNFYTSLPLVYYLSKQGIHCVGTVQQNRLPNCRLPDKKALMKTSVPRGTYEERISHHDGVDFSATVWKDNKVVTLLSTYVGAEPVGKVSRYDKKAKQKIDTPCPKIVQEYNMHMGGVDLMDSFLGRYRVRVKSRKWYLRLFYHLLDLTVINSWILLKKNRMATGVPKKQVPNLGEFRNSLADTLCNIGSPSGCKRGRPSIFTAEPKKQKGSQHPTPSKDVRLDGLEHWPVFASRLRCKMPNCKGTTQWSCTKCNVPLCLNQRNNCFKDFHTY